MNLLLISAVENTTVWQVAWEMLRWHNPLGFLFMAILGAAFGSFANVVIYRLPRRQSILRPASYCPHCRKPIPVRHNVPVLSYFILMGRSACCAQPISPRYPLVELLGALLLGSLYLLDGLTFKLAFHAAWMILLLILAVIDLQHYRLPNVLVAVGAALSLLWLLVAPDHSWLDAGFGVLAGGILAGLVMLLSKAMKGQWGGMGDLKLSLVLGFTFGPGRFLYLYLLASLMAIVYYVLMSKRLTEKRLPMGPFFAVGVWITIWSGNEVVRWYLSLFG